ncbi:hypothetical protein KGF54_005403 [Candida jiufengensis]|uniref:uncharacterized protein n=1 Tax=Candida jiufengensis TaxID=497108 RepID=UPI002223F9A6|nr:uncharacterized protein KGF54_005403 [Candida jiufengensis]KAI5949925.1 hypothetical protein KGF54_005403 [Candida jiufengensis]
MLLRRSIIRTRTTFSIIQSNRQFTNTSPNLFFDKKLPSKEEQDAAFNKIKKVLSENPELMELTIEFKKILDKKGLLSNGGKPSITQMMKLLADKEVRDHGSKLKEFLDSKDTGLTKDELATITGAYMFQGKDIN